MQIYWYVKYIGAMRKLKKKELTIKQQKKVYDALYYLADLMLEKYRPCQIEQVEPKDGFKRTVFDVICTRGRRYVGRYANESDRGTCCGGCKYLSIDGCTVRCLGCKLFLCDYILGITKYGTISYGLGALKAFAWSLNEKFVAYYVSKADIFDKKKKIYVENEEIVAKNG